MPQKTAVEIYRGNDACDWNKLCPKLVAAEICQAHVAAEIIVVDQLMLNLGLHACLKSETMSVLVSLEAVQFCEHNERSGFL